MGCVLPMDCTWHGRQHKAPVWATLHVAPTAGTGHVLPAACGLDSALHTA